MRHRIAIKLFVAICFVFYFSFSSKAQLCTGSLGDPVVNITFGAGPNPGPALPAGATNLTYVNFDCPNDNYYAIRNQTYRCFSNSWHTILQDHTGDPNGYFMLVNGSIQPNDFYVDTVHGLCQGTTFEFASWITNLILPTSCGGNTIQPNITFSIETTTGTKLATFNSGNIPPTATTLWQQYGFYFKTPTNISDVVIRMTNNAPGGCGNDVGLDDITFRPCGPLITPSVSNGADTAINLCESDTAAVALHAAISGGYTSPQYQWQQSTDNGATWADIPGADSTTYLRRPTGAGKYLYRLAVAQKGNIGLATCRVASAPLTVNVNPVPVATLVNDGPKCAGSVFTLTAGGGTAYSWAGPGGFADTGRVVTIAKGANGAKYYDTVANVYGCKSVDSTVLLAFANPVAKFFTSLPACANAAVTFTSQPTVASNETIAQTNWFFGDGTNSAAATPRHAYAQAGTYNDTLVVLTDKGCTDTTIQTLAVHNLPHPAFVLPKVCLSDPFASFTDASTIADSTESGFAYKWHFGDPGATAANPDSSTQQNPKHSYTATGVYSVRLMVTSNNGCVADTTEPFTVNGAFPKASFVLNNGGSICSNAGLVLTDNSTVNFGDITNIEVYWDYTNDTLNRLVDDSTRQGKQYTTQYPVFDDPALKSYSIRYLASSGINCVSEIDTVVTVLASPLLVFDTIGPVCQGTAPYYLTQARETGSKAGTGVYSGSGIDPSGLFNPAHAGLGLDTIRYTYTAPDGCRAYLQQTVWVLAQPYANAGPGRQLLQGGSLLIAASAGGSNPSYLWLPNDYINSDTILTPTVSPPADITYTFTVTSSDGCVSQDSMHITVLKTPLVPNAFSPNGDGINDLWQINYLSSYANVTVQVFNRYGQQVYASTGYSTPWDGALNGRPLPVGTYYYIIDRKVAGAGKLTGSVTIIR